jgi:hypothetical protein
MATREQLRFQPRPGDFELMPSGYLYRPRYMLYRISDRIIDGLMEDDPDKPNYKRLRRSVEQNFKDNLSLFFPFVGEFQVGLETTPDVLTGDALTNLHATSSYFYNIFIEHTKRIANNQITNFMRLTASDGGGMDYQEHNILGIQRAVVATAEGINAKKERKKFAVEKLTGRVGDIMAERGAPADPLMLQKEVGKYLGGKRRRKSKKARKSRRKTRRNI